MTLIIGFLYQIEGILLFLVFQVFIRLVIGFCHMLSFYSVNVLSYIDFQMVTFHSFDKPSWSSCIILCIYFWIRFAEFFCLEFLCLCL